MIDKFISCMKEQGWTVERNEEQRSCLPEPMKSRYTGYPESWGGICFDCKKYDTR